MKKLIRILLPFTAAAALILAIVALSTSAFAQDDGGSETERSTLRTPGDVAYLSGPAQGDPFDIALDFIQSNKAVLGLTEADLSDFVVARRFTDDHNGVTYVTLQQRYAGIEVHNAFIRISIAPDGSVINLSSSFVSNLSAAVNATEPAISAEQAVEAAASANGLSLSETLEVLAAPAGNDQATLLSSGGVSRNDIPARLRYQPLADGSVRLAWESEIYTLDSLSYWVSRVDAASGKTLASDNLVANDNWGALYQARMGVAGVASQAASPPAAPDAPDEYRVYAIPVESPNHTAPLPPADARTLEVNPANSSSPFGWHDTNGANGPEFTITQGNNANAYRDSDNNDLPDPGSQPDGGALLEFDFPIDLTMAPSAYIPAAVTNLFYWNNIIHDVMHNYGFDEPSGNFQENNYGNGGLGSDYVNAEAQDGGGNCNANFFTPADGSNPRMQMYTCDLATPDRDGDLDNAVIIHEYGHGISNRLTGVSCLFNAEQAGEGWSDWYALMMTQETGDAGTDSRGMGTYLFGQPANGPGIRPAPYSTDFGINDYTYGDIGGLAVPHGVGFVWATMTWEMTWELIGVHGFNPDIYDAWSTGGNNLAMQLVTDGLKIQPCNPGFVDSRDGILSADMALTGGANQCTIWEAFARRGLGFSASQGSSGSTTDGTEAFDMPPACSFVDVTPVSQNICVGETAAYTVSVGTAFTPPVDLSAAGNPVPTTASFSPNPVPSVPGTSDLTIGNTGGAAAGNYNVTVTGDDGVVTGSATVGLNIYSGAPGAPTLSQPPNGANGVPPMPTFEWNAATGGTDYFLEVATDAGFTNVVYSANVSGTSHTALSGLAPNTLHFWRVTAMNPCGTGGTSTTFLFTTANLICSSPGLPIPDSGGGTASDTINVGTGGEITDLNLYLDVSHTWVGDLVFTLEHQDTANTVIPVDRPGRTTSGFGCSGDNIDATINDEGTDGNAENQCDNAPALHGDLVGGDPANTSLMTAYDGEDLGGDWILTIEDFAGGDTGTLNQWCLVPATAATGYSIDMEKTVGTDPSVCAAGDSITLPYGGGEVTYCYTVTNTGQNPLTTHTLVDDQLGVLLLDFPFTLNPGASAFLTETTTLTDTTINTATWTATDGVQVVNDVDSATVTVEPPNPMIDVDPDAVSSTQAPDAVITQTLAISNIGTGDLDWTIDESSGQASQGSAGISSGEMAARQGTDLSTGSAAETVAAASGQAVRPAVPAASGEIFRPQGSILFDNGPLVNSPGTGVGGADESVLQNLSLGMTVFGFGHQVVANNRIADDFIITGDDWTIDTITFYAYQTGSGNTSTITAVNLQIWDGMPGAGGSVIWGDTTTNVLATTTWAGVYRVLEDTSGANVDRPVMANTVNIGGLTLPAGTYWLDWQTDGTLGSGPWAPPVTINGQTTTGNAIQNVAGGGWVAAMDIGQQGFPFIINGSSGGVCSPSDIPWVSVNPLSGSTPGGDSDLVSVIFDSTGLTAGSTYTGTLCVNSNDAVTPQVAVPLTLTVETPTYGVVVSGDQAQSGMVGTTITYTVMVTNTGNVADVFDLTVTGNTWTTNLSSNSVVVNPGQSVAVMVWVDVPAGAGNGDMDMADFTATSQGDGSVSDSATLMSTAVTPGTNLYLPVIRKNS